LAGALQAVQHFIANAMDNPLAAVVGLAVGAAVLVGTLATGGGLLLALGAAGAAAFTWSFAVGAVDNVVFGGAGGRYVQNTLGDSAVGNIIAARNTLMVLGMVADAALIAGEIMTNLGYVVRIWGGTSREFGASWATVSDFLRGNLRRGFGLFETNLGTRITLGRVRGGYWGKVWGRASLEGSIPGSGGYPELVFGQWVPTEINSYNVGASFAHDYIRRIGTLHLPKGWI
jgi:hypothetical protein